MRNRLTAPSAAVVRTLDQRRVRERRPAVRTDAGRDRDRILYSSAFLRLGHVTQVASPEVGHIFHSRLTHSLKVAQVARRLAEQLLHAKGTMTGASAKLVDALDADATEAAALAHDLGHPPFGHLAEQELESRSADIGGFEGNAQSFRILTRLAVRSSGSLGINLTRRTLNGVLKYPWVRGSAPSDSTKWGVYDADQDYFDWVREGFPPHERSLEAELMDWADDVTYAVHDMDDFYRAGLVPLDRLTEPGEELDAFTSYVASRHPERESALTEAAQRLFLQFFPGMPRYRGHAEERAHLRKVGSELITRYIDALTLSNAGRQTAWLEIDDLAHAEVTVLKDLTWFYIIERPSLAVIQRGQRTAIGTLFELFTEAAESDPIDGRMFPPAFAELLQRAADPRTRRRIVVDFLAGMTEDSAVEIYRRAVGTSSGSLLASGIGPS